jgi:8-oxo-dGTP pyrophosphatase MutT (NUDIX family)
VTGILEPGEQPAVGAIREALEEHEARVNDDESIAVGWFALNELPDIPNGHREAIQEALTNGATRFALS